MEIAQLSTGRGKPFFISSIINATFGLVVYGLISFLGFQYFDNFWANWVLFVSCLIIAFMIRNGIDPYKGNWTINGWIPRSLAVAIIIVLAFTIGF